MAALAEVQCPCAATRVTHPHHITICLPLNLKELHLHRCWLTVSSSHRLCSVAGEPACRGLIKGVSHVQEYFVEDMIEVLMYVSRFRPQVLEGVPMEELLLFFVTFMGSPAYIKNPYLRSRMVEVSHANPSGGASCCTRVSWHSSDQAVRGALESVAHI